MYLEADDYLNIHMANTTMRGNTCTGKGGAIYGEILSETSELTVSMHDCRLTENQARMQLLL